jgi:hypothetical protein
MLPTRILTFPSALRLVECVTGWGGGEGKYCILFLIKSCRFGLGYPCMKARHQKNCDKCGFFFPNADCFSHHRKKGVAGGKSICQQRFHCPDCGNVIFARARKHKCAKDEVENLAGSCEGLCWGDKAMNFLKKNAPSVVPFTATEAAATFSPLGSWKKRRCSQRRRRRNHTSASVFTTLRQRSSGG